MERAGLLHEELTEQILGAGIEVHKALGLGLLESVYEQCLCHELNLRDLRFVRQTTLPVRYKGIQLDCGYRVDLIVEDSVVVEVKAVERVIYQDMRGRQPRQTSMICLLDVERLVPSDHPLRGISAHPRESDSPS